MLPIHNDKKQIEIMYTFLSLFSISKPETCFQCNYALCMKYARSYQVPFLEIGFIRILSDCQDLPGCLRRLSTDSRPESGVPLSCPVQWKETLRPS